VVRCGKSQPFSIANPSGTIRAQMKKARTGEAASETIKTSATLPRELWTQARVFAVKNGRDLQDVISDALREYLKKHDTPRG
jgi:hypothetical protein